MDFANLDEILAAAADHEAHVKEKPPVRPGLVCHVDGDYLAYYASGNDECEEWQARENAFSLIRSAMEASGADSAVVHNTVSGSTKGERFIIATVKPYQGQRDADRKPKNYAFMRKFLMGYDGDKFKVKNWNSREADDGIGACAHHALGTPAGYASIFTRDKDMQMLPGLHVDWLTRQTTKVEPGCFDGTTVVGLKERVYGTKFFWLQMLMGDTADHIPGLPGYAKTTKGVTIFKPIGEKTAHSFLAECKNNDDACEVVRALYQGFYDPKGESWADHFCEQAALLWMRTDFGASVGDFARHTGVSKITDRFCDELWAAVERLETRVKETREQADALTNP